MAPKSKPKKVRPRRAVQCAASAAAAPPPHRCRNRHGLRTPHSPPPPSLPFGKQKKESAEARKARLDMEALAAAEAEEARQADARRALRERAEREAALTAANTRRLDAEWLQRMRHAKLEELREETRLLSKEHDAQVDRRDRLIEVRGWAASGAVCVRVALKAAHEPSTPISCSTRQPRGLGALIAVDSRQWAQCRPGAMPPALLPSPTTPPSAVQTLLEDVAAANKQHSLSAAAHAEVLDSLAELHTARMAALKARFDGDLAAMGREFEG